MSPKATAPKFAQALRAVRIERGLSQEDFYEVSGRTYVSRLENDGADPTLAKTVQLAQVLDVHPLTLLTLTFCNKGTPAEVERLLSGVRDEIASFDKLRLDMRQRRPRSVA
ncbi:helix-turn-helix domain-containing protein [Roseateles saccharophilus]|uniref:Transcriptional regulator with XRE-family HTH domain n=1 Tax=Roseateles saccharophilus TaxID=304 RepID=A0A4R3UVG2_ROSSA|nr:helix-turn-helix transcriptional regulator [Roseateles saccharophilus]MBL8277958.1 helix-turn-helix transcriptional regulator [Roseateles sp.]MDG0833121.1 XRE family transcriptional regulator [Roseateles saccharophilus]TCU94588.1 transcriptional regulator with XRE-family HTH domain [Roseateles saccharophilus]